MRRPVRPRSASSQGRRGQSSDATQASRDRKEPSGPGAAPPAGPPHSGRAGSSQARREGPPSSGTSSRPRPHSAQARRESPQARRAAVQAEKALQQLQEQSLELKRTANSLTEENTKARTRLRVLERDLQRRDRLLRQLAALKKVGQGIDTDIIEKLREERNTLPLVRKKAQDLAQLVEQKEQEIKDLKRDPQFTRIIELQVEYATWQHEAKRLHSLMQDSSLETSGIARQEIDVHERRVRQLENDLAAAGDRKTKVAADLEVEEEEHREQNSQYREKEKELQKEQEITRELAIDFKKILQERKQVEQMQDEIEQMKLAKQKYEQELASSPAYASSPKSGAKAPLSRASVSQAAVSSPLPASQSKAGGLLRALRRATALRACASSLFAECLSRDVDQDGLLSKNELAQVLSAVGVGPCSHEDLTALLELAPATVGTPSGSSQLRWLDLLVILDRFSAVPSPPTAPLPPLGPLRAACLRSEVSLEEFQRRLCATASVAEAEAFFAGLGLESPVVSAWCAAWETYGAEGLLLRLPMGEVAFEQAESNAWFSRCVDAVRKHRKDLLDAFKVWREDMRLEQEQFSMVCCDVLGLDLSHDDVADLALFLNGGHGGPIDGEKLLRIEELRRAGQR